MTSEPDVKDRSQNETRAVIRADSPSVYRRRGQRVTIRTVHACERQLVEALRYEVYVAEMGKPYAIADRDNQRLGDEADPVSTIRGAFIEERLVGTIRCTMAAAYQQCGVVARGLDIGSWTSFVQPQRLAVCSRFVVARDSRPGGGVSMRLMLDIYEYLRGVGVHVCLCSAHETVALYFERFGFRRYAAPFLDALSGREQIPMALCVADTDHLDSVRSPFLTVERCSESATVRMV